MIEQNFAIAGLSTDYEISTILGNFSEDYIYDIMRSALDYRFRPFGPRSPEYPVILKQQFENIKLHSTGHDNEILEKEEETYLNIIKIICDYYQLRITEEIPTLGQAYTLAYYMYKIFCSEFSDRMINMFSNYIINNKISLVNSLASINVTKTNYSNSIYTDKDYIAIYDNMQAVLEMIASLDIQFEDLVSYLSDNTVANMICTYIQDSGDIYKNHFAVYILNPATTAEMLSSIRLNFVNKTMQNMSLFDPSTNPYIIK